MSKVWWLHGNSGVLYEVREVNMRDIRCYHQKFTGTNNQEEKIEVFLQLYCRFGDLIGFSAYDGGFLFLVRAKRFQGLRWAFFRLDQWVQRRRYLKKKKGVVPI